MFSFFLVDMNSDRFDINAISDVGGIDVLVFAMTLDQNLDLKNEDQNKEQRLLPWLRFLREW